MIFYMAVRAERLSQEKSFRKSKGNTTLISFDSLLVEALRVNIIIFCSSSFSDYYQDF